MRHRRTVVVALLSLWCLSPALAQTPDPLQWKAFRSAKAGVAFRYPPGFDVRAVRTSETPCDFTIELSHTRYDTVGTAREVYDEGHPALEDGDRILAIEYETYYTLTLSDEDVDTVAAEAGFKRREGVWHIEWTMPEGMPKEEAEVISREGWLGMKAMIPVRYYYSGGDLATAAGHGHQYFAVQRRDAECAAFVEATEYDHVDGEEEFAGMVSSITFLNAGE